VFRRVWWQGFRSVWSDEGYGVSLRGLRKGLTYTEGDYCIRIATERARGRADWIIYLDAIRNWQPPHANEPLGEERRKLIRQRVVAALNFLKVRYHLSD
jgi:Immunity protein 74